MKIGDTGIAECHSCGRKFFHVYGSSDHVCERCGKPLVCGVAKCVEIDEKRIRQPKGVTR